MEIGSNSTDLDVQRCTELVRFLRERRADQQEISAALQIVAPQLAQLTGLLTAPSVAAASTSGPTPTCAKPTRHVSVGVNMPKHKMQRSLDETMGHLYRRGKPPNQMWYGRYRRPALMKDGTIRSKTKNDRLGPVSTISEAKAQEELRRRISRTRSQPAPTASITLKEYYERHFWPDKERRLKRSGLDSIANTFKHILAALGDTPLVDIDRDQIQTLCDLIYAQDKQVTANKIRSHISGLLKYAMARKVITVNPAADVWVPAATPKDLFTPTEQHVRAILATTRDPAYRPAGEMVLFASATAAGRAEMFGLRWKRLNLADEPTTLADGRNLPARTAAIVENCCRKKFGTVKTKQRNRLAPLPEAVVETLRRLKEGSRFTGPDDLVFCNAVGGPLEERRMDRKLKAAAQQAGVLLPKGACWHCFRRYFATQADRKGMLADDRQRTLGHASAAMTEHYTEADLERRRPYVEQIIKGVLP